MSSKKEPIRDGFGNVKPTHECPNRSPLAKAIAYVVKMEDPPRVAWNLVLTGEALQCVAIRYCPWCGVDLFAGIGATPYIVQKGPPSDGN